MSWVKILFRIKKVKILVETILKAVEDEAITLEEFKDIVSKAVEVFKK